MKRYIILLWLLAVQQAQAQSANTVLGNTLSHYVLDKFYPGKVYLGSGEVSDRLLNYNALTKEMIFEDKGKYLAIANPQNVDSVIIAGRKFIPGNQKFYEWIAGNSYPLMAEYICSIKEEAASAGYGINPENAASNSLKSLYGTGTVYALQLPDNFKVESKVVYYLRKDQQYHKIQQARHLANLLPGKKQFINEWVKARGTDFSKRDELAALVAQLQ